MRKAVILFLPALTLAVACATPPTVDDRVDPLPGHWQLHYFDLEGRQNNALVICISTLDFNFVKNGASVSATQIGDNVIPCYGSQNSPYPDFIVKNETIPHVNVVGDSIEFEFGKLVTTSRGRIIGDSMAGTSTWVFRQPDGSTVTVVGPWTAKKR